MRILAKTALASFVAAGMTSSALFAFTQVGHGKVMGVVSGDLTYDSNIFVSNSEVSDTVGTLDGGVHYVRDASQITCDGSVGLLGQKFFDHSSQDSIDPYSDIKLGLAPSDDTDVHGEASLRRSTIANEQVNDRTKSNDFALSGFAQHLFAEKTGLRLTADYGQQKYLTTGYSNVFDYNVGVDGVYVYSPKLTLLAGVTNSEWWTEHRSGRPSANTDDWRYTVGAEGEIAPKVTGKIDIGLIQRDFQATGFQNHTGLYTSTQLTWAAAEKTTVTLMAQRTWQVSADDQALKLLATTLTLTQALSQKVTFTGTVGYTHSNYDSFARANARRDDGYTIRGRVDIAIRDNLSVNVSAGYTKNDSNVVFSDYNRTNIGAGVSFRF